MSSFKPFRMTYREACKQAIRDALLADARCFVMGEDVGKYGGCYAVTKGLLEEFGPARIVDTPLAEVGFVGAGVGASNSGMKASDTSTDGMTNSVNPEGSATFNSA